MKGMRKISSATPADRFRFDDPDRAVVFHRHDLPSPWINYLSNGSFHAFVSQAGGGLCWWKSPTVFRLTRYRMYNLPLDSPGFHLYVRESDGATWSPTFRPCETPLDAWEARHRPGRSAFSGRRGDVEVSLELFVAPDHDALVWDAAVTNRGNAPLAVDLFAYVELSQFQWLEELQWGCYIKSMLNTWRDKDTDAVLYLCHNQSHPRIEDCPLVYFACTRPLAGFSGDRDAFVGPYRSERNPVAVERNRAGDAGIEAGEPCAAGQVKLVVPPGGTERLQWFLGVVPGALKRFPEAMAGLRAALAALRAPGAVDAQRDKLDAWWNEHLSVYSCEAPDETVQRQVNLWNPVQSVHNGRYSRSISFYAPGVRGVGFRDTAQDMLAIAYRKPEWAADSLLRLLAGQYRDGHAVHAVFPEERQPPWTSVHSDDHLWLHPLAHALVAETGDLGLLDRRATWLGPDHTSADGDGTVWEHLLAALAFTESRLGAHGLPLILRSDWNDIIGRFARAGRGESVMAAQQYVLALRLMTGLARSRGDEAGAERLAALRAKQERAILACAWDGEWWRRAFDDDGNPVGHRDAKWGKIFLNSQTWAVIGGVGSQEQWRRAMDAVRRDLDTGVGLRKIAPGFATFPQDPDPFVGYNPGCGENGAIFCHANAWAVIAEALLGRGERAWAYYLNLLPERVLAKVGLDRYQAEAYAYCSNIVGPENARFGWANVTQLTGTAAWMDVAVTQYLLGVRPELDGLRVDPCIPAEWAGFRVRRRYRGALLDIRVENPRRVEYGVGAIEVDGARLEGGDPVIPPRVLQGKSSATIRVVMGRAS